MENPVGYLYKVGRNKARRRMSRRAPVFAGETVVGIPDIEPGLPAALDRLSERQRVVVVLVHSYQWTLAEVAELLGLSKSSVQNHLERGMVHLRGVLGGVD
jgi:DNA-directed RNA polymerase specialized sigma24 family protein